MGTATHLMHDTIATWGKHTFTVCPQDTEFCDFPGVYIFAGISAERGWFAMYVAWTESLQSCLLDHRQWDRAVGCGATHVHAMSAAAAADGQSIADALIEEFQPALNVIGE